MLTDEYSSDIRPISNIADIEAARLLLDRLGVKISDLQNVIPPGREIPTFTRYIPIVKAATPSSNRKTWAPYWDVLGKRFDCRPIDSVSTSELMALSIEVERDAKKRPGAKHGRGARANFVSATKAFYKYAINDAFVDPARNPAAPLRKPRQRKTHRRALSMNQLAQIHSVAATTGSDPALDTLVLRLHMETACRRGGALALRACDLFRENCTILLHEKGCTTREQPISPTLMSALIVHTEERNPSGRGTDQLLRRKNGDPMGRSRYLSLWQRLGRHLPWIVQEGITTHWIRYTTLTWIERNYSYGLAAAFAGHTSGGNTGSTLTYVPAKIEEVATALSKLVGEPHPLAMK